MVRRDGWKLECNYGESDYGEDGALYDLGADPNELTNLFGHAEHQLRVDQLKQVVLGRFDHARANGSDCQ